MVADSKFLKNKEMMDYSLFIVVEQVKPQSEKDLTHLENKLRYKRNSYLSSNKEEIYHIGIIDYIQLWDTRKKQENLLKSTWFSKDKYRISAVEPTLYMNRFQSFIIDHVLNPKDDERSIKLQMI